MTLSSNIILESLPHPVIVVDQANCVCAANPAAEDLLQHSAEVLNGTHVLLRDFAYISACPHNRWSFVLVVQDGLSSLSSGQELSSNDLLQLLRPGLCSVAGLTVAPGSLGSGRQLVPRA